MTKPCPVCGAAASGKFCSQCGSSLEAERVCGDCGNAIPPGGRFCNACGKPVTVPDGERAPAGPTHSARAAAASARPPTSPSPGTGSKTPWVIGGVAVALVAAVIIIPRLGSDPAPAATTTAPAGQAAAPEATGTPPDLSSMTPEDAALRLFTRVLTSAESGDSAQARTFAPMAISAYGMLPELTLDHRYDMAMIHFVTGDVQSAAAQADTILAAAPTHLFGLAAAAEAAARMGDTESAREYYQKYVDSYEAEVSGNAVAYEMHPNLPAAIRMAALAYLNGSSAR